MKLRTKITLIFVFLTALLQITTFAFVFHFARKYTEKEFYLRLKQRATIAAQTYLEEDELAVENYEGILRSHLQILPDEKEEIYKVDAAGDLMSADSGSPFPPAFFEEILESEYAETQVGDRYATGLLYHDNEGDFIIVLSASDPYGEGKLDNLRSLLLFSFLAGLLLLWLFGRYAAKQALSPISRIIKKVNTIRATNLHLRLDAGANNDELAELAITFNNMLDRLETSFDLQSNFINNASHELRNPLTAILGQLEIALNKNRHPEEYRTILHGIESEAMRLDTMVNGLLKLAQADFDNKGFIIAPFRLDEVILEINNIIDKSNPDNHISLEFGYLPPDEGLLVVMGSQSLLGVALKNILDNACKFSRNKLVTLRLLADSEHLKIIITDEGIGIPPEDLKNIYEPFFRGSNARGIEGFGFGLPLAYRIIKLHRGELRVTSQIGKGTMVKITLPNQATYSSLAG